MKYFCAEGDVVEGVAGKVTQSGFGPQRGHFGTTLMILLEVRVVFGWVSATRT